MTKIIATLGPVSERSENIKKINQFTNLFELMEVMLTWIGTKCVGNVRQISRCVCLLDVKNKTQNDKHQ